MMPETSGRKNVKLIIATIELKDNHFESIMKYSADFKKEDTGIWENEFRDRVEVCLKSNVCGFSKHWYCTTKIWGVEIHMQGADYNSEVCFKRNAAAQEFCDALLNWLK